MRSALLAALWVSALFSSGVSAQVIVDRDRIGKASGLLDSKDENPIQCDVRAIKPSLNYVFRFQAGYVFRVPLKHYVGRGHLWVVVIRITPQGNDAKPVYMIDLMRLPEIPETKSDGEASGFFLLGEGRYNVTWMMSDDSGRTCHKSWELDATLGRGDKSVKVAMPPGTVGGLSYRGLPMRGSPVVSRETDNGPLPRLTLLVDTAPLVVRRTSRAGMGASDRAQLLAMLSALIERVPGKTKIVLFNLEQQQELMRREDFTLAQFNEIPQALNRLSLGTIDAHTLANPGGRSEMLAKLINDELRADPAADAVVFFGPQERYDEKLPPEALDKPGEGAPRFFYLQYRPPRRPNVAMVPDPLSGGRGTGRQGEVLPPQVALSGSADFPDSISRAVDRLKGETIRIHNPSEFAKALERLERRTRPSADRKAN